MNLTEIDFTKIKNDFSDGYYVVNFRGIQIPIRYTRGESESILIGFHGAINRERFNIPKFQSNVPDLGDCHQLRVADATLTQSRDLSLGWYLGGKGFPFQNILIDFLQVMYESLGIKRRVYYGGSAGGFAALYFSFFDPESACIAVNPQVDLNKYRSTSVKRYLSAAWPDAKSLSEVDDITVDLPMLYRGGFRNLVVYLQSTGDTRHFFQQLPLFLRYGVKETEKFILQCSYWGIPDHGNSVPPSAYLTWIRALLGSQSLDRQVVLDTYNALITTGGGQEPGSSNSTKAINQQDQAVSPQDRRLADLLRDYHLRHPMEG